jgi:hypothetical protein
MDYRKDMIEWQRNLPLTTTETTISKIQQRTIYLIGGKDSCGNKACY